MKPKPTEATSSGTYYGYWWWGKRGEWFCAETGNCCNTKKELFEHIRDYYEQNKN